MLALASSNTSFGSTFIASVSIFHPRYIFENCPCSMEPSSSQIWRISTSNWHRAQLAIVDKPYLQETQRSLLTSQLLCVWLAVSNAHFPVLSRKPSESVKTRISTAHISKTKTNFSKIPSKLFSGLQNLVIEINLSRRFSWPLISFSPVRWGSVWEGGNVPNSPIKTVFTGIVLLACTTRTHVLLLVSKELTR